MASGAFGYFPDIFYLASWVLLKSWISGFIISSDIYLLFNGGALFSRSIVNLLTKNYEHRKCIKIYEFGENKILTNVIAFLFPYKRIN